MQLPDQFNFYVTSSKTLYVAELHGTNHYRIYLHPKREGAEFGTHLKKDIRSAIRDGAWTMVDFGSNENALFLLQEGDGF